MGDEEKKQELVHKVILSTGKEVLLRQFKIKHQRMAGKAVANKAGGDPNVMLMLMQEELVKLLVYQIAGETPSKAKLEDLDNVFEYQEYMQIQTVIQEMMGVGAGGVETPKTEIVSI